NVGSVNIPRLRPDGLTTMVPAAPTTTPGPAPAPAPALPTPPGASTQPNPSPSAPLPPPTPTNTTIAFTPSPVTLVPPPAGTAPPDSINTVNITVNGSVFGADLVLSYDPAAFSITQIREGGFLSKDNQLVALVQRIESETGMVRISLERPPG